MPEKTDYTPGDAPVPVGTIVIYRGDRWEVTGHRDPLPELAEEEVAEHCPDGNLYDLWLCGVPCKLDNSHHSRINVRRTSFRIAGEGE